MLVTTTKVTFGADPEFFVARKDNPSVPIPACGLFGGGKKAPIFLTPEGGYLEDGCAVEFNVNPKKSLVEVRNTLLQLITAFLVLNKDYVIVPSPTVSFKTPDLRAHPQANVLGCDADLWAYGLRVKPQVNMFKGRRFAGGHIHIGLDPWPKDLDPKIFVKYLDCFVLPPMGASLGVDPYRYEFYGHPGLYRETSYGVEWRSPDNSWAVPRDNPELDKIWTTLVAQMGLSILDLVHDIDKLGGEKFNVYFNEFLLYTGLEPYLKSKQPGKLAVTNSRAQEYASRWKRTVSGK